MSVVSSSRVSSVSSLLKGIGGKSQIVKPASRVHFKLPKDVKRILCNFEEGKNHKEYEELIRLLREAAIKDNDLAEFLAEARQCISLLSPTHKLFVEVLLKIKWTNRSPEVISNYKLLLEDLICMQIHHTKTITDYLVEMFKPEEDNGAEQEAEEFKAEDLERLNHVHDILHKLLKVMPMANKLLLQSLVLRFPYIVHGTYTHKIYIYALLQILNYAPQLRSDILSIIINRLTVLDVNIPKEEASDDEEDDLMDVDSIETMNDDDPTAVNDDASKTKKAVHPLARTLDACMELFLKYMHEYCFANSVLQIESLKMLYFDILKAFETVILPTHASQYVQYIAFYICSFKATVTEAFVDWLWDKVTNPNVAVITRQSAVYYISSLLATASFVTPSLLKFTISRLAKWIHNYITTQECSEYTHDDAKTHAVFYSVCQAFFHLFITRHKQFIESKNNILFLQQLDFPRIIACRLNPLKVCNSEIVCSFADITRTYQLAYCYTIIENNVRNRLPVLGTETHSSILVPNFFPFESYTLQQSGQRIATLFHNVVDTDSHSSKRHE